MKVKFGGAIAPASVQIRGHVSVVSLFPYIGFSPWSLIVIYVVNFCTIYSILKKIQWSHIVNYGCPKEDSVYGG